MDPGQKRVTVLLQAIGAGDRRAAEDLLPLVYEELRALARARMARTPPGNTLQATALVHEAYMRLLGDVDPGWDGRAHFMGAAARAMRDILVEQARRKGRLRHGGGRRREQIDADDLPLDTPAEDVLSLEDALAKFERIDPRKAEIVMLRYFTGLSVEQIAELHGVSTRTVERDWRFARSWLAKELGAGVAGAGGGAEEGPA